MARGSISHIALTASDLDRSTAFYNKVFEFMGFKRVEVPESTQQAMKTRLEAWVGPGYLNIDPSVCHRGCGVSQSDGPLHEGIQTSGVLSRRGTLFGED
jgi:catechol 2,3-dioxygenase-like lactoylglutathione lyase family enzyme